MESQTLFLGSAGLSLPAQGLMSPWTTVVFTSSPASHWGQPHLSLQPSVHFVDQDDALSVLHHLSPQELGWVVLHHLWRCVPPAASVDRVQLCSSCPVMLGCCGAAGDVQEKASVDVWTDRSRSL